jgi:hypothetical protein
MDEIDAALDFKNVSIGECAAGFETGGSREGGRAHTPLSVMMDAIDAALDFESASIAE